MGQDGAPALLPPQTRLAAEYDSQHQHERGTNHDERQRREEDRVQVLVDEEFKRHALLCALAIRTVDCSCRLREEQDQHCPQKKGLEGPDRKSTRLNSSHLVISYAV